MVFEGFPLILETIVFQITASQVYYHFNPCFLLLIGGAVGVSSVLMIQPDCDGNDSSKGLVIVLMVNMHNTGLNKTAFKISKLLRDIGV